MVAVFSLVRRRKKPKATAPPIYGGPIRFTDPAGVLVAVSGRWRGSKNWEKQWIRPVCRSRDFGTAKVGLSSILSRCHVRLR